MQHAWALGFGQISAGATMGQTLDMTVPVRVDSGERFGADCLSVDVTFGDGKLLPNQVRSTIAAGRSANEYLVHVTTLQPIEEPIVEVGLSAGCSRRFVRRFTAFADPPLIGTSALASAGPRTLSPDASAFAAGQESRHANGRSSHSRGASHAGRAQKGPTRAAAYTAGPRDAKAPAGATANIYPASPAGTAGRGASGTASRLVLDGGYAHLKLDMEAPAALSAPTGASGANAAITLSEFDLDADTRRLQALERNLQTVKKENAASREKTEALQTRLNEAETRNEWMPWLLGLLALALAVAIALAWRLRRQAVVHKPGAWFDEAQAASSPPPPPAPSALQLAAATVRVASPSSALSEMRDPPPSVAGELTDSEPELEVPDRMSVTQPISSSEVSSALALGPEGVARELSVEELLDLEQQADFFIALGQEDAAVDLLMSHLRNAGGQSPLPYTKLLEIYRRQGDRSAYERTRARFNRRFNAYAPDWDTGPGVGRLLEDYPDTIAQIQAAWESPIDAMAILEALLFKRDDSGELFDLPAYRDVLLLYSLARDLWQQSGGASEAPVDVLLPLDDAGFEPIPAPAPALSAREPEPESSAARTHFDLGALQLMPPHGDEASRTDEASRGGVRATLDASNLADPPPSQSS